MDTLRNIKENHPGLLYGFLSIVVIGAVIGILVLSFANNTSNSEEAKSNIKSTDYRIDTSLVKGLSNLSFLPDKGVEYLSKLQDFLSDDNISWPCALTIYPAQDQDNSKASIYAKVEQGNIFVLCTYNSSLPSAYSYSFINSIPDSISGQVEYSAVAPNFEQNTSTTTPNGDQNSQSQAQTQTQPEDSSQQNAQEPQSQTSTPTNEIKASDWQTLSSQLPQEAAYRLGDDITRYLSNKGISADGKNALINMYSFVTKGGLIQFSARITDNSGVEHSLSIEWNQSRNSYGMSLV